MENEHHLVTRFVGGLRSDIEVKLQPFLNLSGAITYAESVEKINELNSRKKIQEEVCGMSTPAISLLLDTFLLLSSLKNKRKTKLVIQMGRRLK